MTYPFITFKMSKNLIIVFFFCISFTKNYSQSEIYKEIGVMAGPVFFQSDYGQRGSFENYLKQNGFSIGVFYYLNFNEKFNHVLRENFKLRLEASYMKSQLKHYGQWVDPSRTSLIANQLRAMRGSVGTLNFGLQAEYYPLKTDDYCFNCKWSPYISLGTQISNYRSEAHSTLGPLGNPATTPDKYMNAYRSGSKLVASATAGLGVRYKFAKNRSFIFDYRLQYYFSDWVDGLNPNRSIYTENKTNDYSTTFNFGYVYYFE